MITNKFNKKLLCIIALVFLIIGIIFGYWFYLDYKFENNPQFYYKSRTITP